MRSKKEEKEQLTSCQYCGVRVKEKNLSKHLHNVHAWRMRKEARAKAKSMRYDGYTVRKRRTMKLALLAVGVLALLSASVYAYINAQNDVSASSSVGSLSVELVDPSGGETLSSIANIRWSAYGDDSNEVKITIQYSTDPPPWCPFCPRQTWHSLATDLENDGVFEWDTTQFPNGGYTLKIMASDGTNTPEYRSEIFIINN